MSKERHNNGDAIEATHCDTRGFGLGRSSYQVQSQLDDTFARRQEVPARNRMRQNLTGRQVSQADVRRCYKSQDRGSPILNPSLAVTSIRLPATSPPVVTALPFGNVPARHTAALVVSDDELAHRLPGLSRMARSAHFVFLY
ncbi:hypothetical protein BU17DRAFT_66013 [Hysterangium stoloniferum]|nr:hypothetical protein BU17DRAFT_66013 [Hysterangium stoloniferum]